jgi:hypothetical protein
VERFFRSGVNGRNWWNGFYWVRVGGTPAAEASGPKSPSHGSIGIVSTILPATVVWVAFVGLTFEMPKTGGPSLSGSSRNLPILRRVKAVRAGVSAILCKRLRGVIALGFPVEE